jgi:two-component system LytT family sensor kinase
MNIFAYKLNRLFKKNFLIISLIWIVPILLVLIESVFYLFKISFQSVYVYYFSVFWGLRAILSPFIVLWTNRFLDKPFPVINQVLFHLLGFVLFSILFWIGAYLLLNKILYETNLFAIGNSLNGIRVFALIAENSISNNVMVYAVNVAFCYIWKLISRNKKAAQNTLQLENSLLVSRMELLRNQLNTHFLFNTLNTISSFVVRKQTEEANRTLISLSKLLRFALKENKEQLISLQKELSLLQLYLDIQQTRFKERLQVSLNIDPACMDTLVPAMILQPIVENAVKFAVAPYTSTGIIAIVIKKENSRLHFRVSDNGKKLFAEINFDHGIGLANTRERLKQLYGNQYSFQILPGENGYGVSINLSFANALKPAYVENINSR